MHKRNRSTTKSENSQTYQLYNYDSLEWSWAHYTIIITLILLFLSNLFGDVITNNDNPYTELSYREKRSVSRNKKYAKKDIDEFLFQECDETKCLLPSCKCPNKDSPNSIPHNKLPQFVLISIDSPITKNIYIMRNKAKNLMNGKLSNIPYTFFVTGDETDYYYVEKLYCENDEISIHTYDKYSNGNVPRDIQSLKLALNNLSNVPNQELKGFRSPQQILSKNIFSNLLDLNVVYDSSLELSLDNGYWPFTLDYGIPFLNNTNLQGQSFSGLWEIPILSIPNAKSQKMSELSESNNDIYFVTYNQLINWMKNPITTDAINLMNKSEYEITEQKPKKELSCKSPNKCKYSSTYFSTCSKCPFQSPSPKEPNPFPLFLNDSECDKQMPEGGCGNGMWECGCVCLNHDNNLDGFCINNDGQCFTPKYYDEENDEYICSDNIISTSEIVNGTRQITVTTFNQNK
ncbi:hypothetical protein LY90DRAFT_507448 [Neocallimastix californiae]|uniref:Uncharacterized protein n=1 Tax=Neocallimastix californiae TaxID=1754190 RepID=A0A1Y2D5R0_9FUNG|nr:hypothetical protein LY90DRAFT_507448 [Neocallimastix californiae]|eukprot:ORY54638.1 hypothetical protein LY90DRAFT_507448 [Neocallimastix californiae]